MQNNKTPGVPIIYLNILMIVIAKKNWFMKDQEASRLLSGLGLKSFLNKIPCPGDILSYVILTQYKYK